MNRIFIQGLGQKLSLLLLILGLCSAAQAKKERKPTSIEDPQQTYSPTKGIQPKYSIQAFSSLSKNNDLSVNASDFRSQITKKLVTIDRKIKLLDEKVWSRHGASSKNLQFKVHHIKDIRANLSNNLKRLDRNTEKQTYKRLRASVASQYKQLLSEVKNALD